MNFSQSNLPPLQHPTPPSGAERGATCLLRGRAPWVSTVLPRQPLPRGTSASTPKGDPSRLCRPGRLGNVFFRTFYLWLPLFYARGKKTSRGTRCTQTWVGRLRDTFLAWIKLHIRNFLTGTYYKPTCIVLTKFIIIKLQSDHDWIEPSL